MTQQIDNIVDKTGLITLVESKNSIKQTNNVLEILDLIKQVADQNTLVVFDVDNVLMLQGDTIIRTGLLKYILKNIFKVQDFDLHKKIFSAIENYELYAPDLRGEIPVDEKMQDVIKYLEENKIKSLALTHASYLAEYNGVTYDQVRYEALKKLGIDFIKLSRIGQNSEIISLENGDQIKLHNGIIFARNQKEEQLNKGVCLNATLEKLSYKPSKVIFIDDIEKNHFNVMKTCSAKNIEFHGFHYIKAYEIEDVHHAYDRAVLQLETLGNQGKWLNDAEADRVMMEKQSNVLSDTAAGEVNPENPSFLGWLINCFSW